MELTYREMTMEDYEAAISIWSKTEGVVLNDGDSRTAIANYLDAQSSAKLRVRSGWHAAGDDSMRA